MSGFIQSLRFVQIVQTVVGVDSARPFDSEKSLLRKIDATSKPSLSAGYVWRITYLNSSRFQTFKSFNRYASFKTLMKMTANEFLEISECAIGAVICTGCLRRRSVTACLFSIM